VLEDLPSNKSPLDFGSAFQENEDENYNTYKHNSDARKRESIDGYKEKLLFWVSD